MFALIGCTYLGPTDGQVRKAIEVTIRGFVESLDQEDIEINNSYANAADFVVRNEDDSLVNQVSIILDENEYHVFGSCTFSDYQDPESEYLLNGEMTFNLWYTPKINANAGYGEMSSSISLTGGIIESLEYSFTIDETGDVEQYLITANGKTIVFTEQDNFFEFLEVLRDRMPG